MVRSNENVTRLIFRQRLLRLRLAMTIKGAHTGASLHMSLRGSAEALSAAKGQRRSNLNNSYWLFGYLAIWLFAIFTTTLMFIGIGTDVAFACGPSFDMAYLVRGSEGQLLAIPEGHFLYELELISKKNKNNGGSGLALALKRDKNVEDETAKADISDLDQALKEDNFYALRRGLALKLYGGLRKSLTEFVKKKQADFYGQRSLISHERKMPVKFYPNKVFLTSLLVPKEFIKYIEGAVAYHNADFDRAIMKWKEILALPKAERQYKTTWASFMIGKAYLSMKKNPEAMAYFEKTREYAKEGYIDSLNLAFSSYGWQALAEYQLGYVISAMHHYFEQLDALSLSFVCRWIFEGNKEVFESVVKDELGRNILVAWLISRPMGYMNYVYEEGYKGYNSFASRLLEAIENLRLEEHVSRADLLAWVAYNTGSMEKARKWLAVSDPNSLAGQWISAKLDMRDGKTDQAITKLKALLPLFEKNEEWQEFYIKKEAIKCAQSELGVLLLNRRDYLFALEAFLRGKYWEDTAYVAEKVLTTTELEAYLKGHKEAEFLSQKPEYLYQSGAKLTIYDSLAYILAKRYFREGNWQKAGEYHPSFIRETFDSLIKHLKTAQNVKLSNRKRAQNYFDAAQLARKYGMALMGTELEPDWAYFEGMYDLDNSIKHRFGEDEYRDRAKEIGLLIGSDEEKQRALASLPTPNKRFHYRYYAAELMWKCAELLPDNDLLTAKALYEGGIYLKGRDPESANKFYKALVRRCSKLPIGQAADKMRWFPKD